MFLFLVKIDFVYSLDKNVGVFKKTNFHVKVFSYFLQFFYLMAVDIAISFYLISNQTTRK